MSAVQKGLGIVILLVGIVLLVGGAAAAVYGAMDAQDHQEDQGPLGVGEDEERTQADQALLVGGLAAAGLGAASIIVGVVLLAAARPKRHQQQVVIAEASAEDEDIPYAALQDQPDDRRDRNRVALVLGAAGVLLLVSIGMALAGGAGGPLGGGDESSGPLHQQTYDGRLALAGSLAGTAPNRHIETFTAPERTTTVRAIVEWEPESEQAEQLQATLQVQRDGAWRDLRTEPLRPGGVLQSQDPGLDGARIRIIVQPVEATFVADQAFTVQVTFLR